MIRCASELRVWFATEAAEHEDPPLTQSSDVERITLELRENLARSVLIPRRLRCEIARFAAERSCREPGNMGGGKKGNVRADEDRP